jgi:DNA-binding FadR family transcriptional regulator
VQSGHLHAVRGRRGGTFVADHPPPAAAPTPELLAGWRDVCDRRLATELGVAVLACERASRPCCSRSRSWSTRWTGCSTTSPPFRQADVRFHIGLAETTASAPLMTSVTEVQGQMSDLIAFIPHPAEVLSWSNAQHRRLVAAVRDRDVAQRDEHDHGPPARHRARARGPAALTCVRRRP